MAILNRNPVSCNVPTSSVPITLGHKLHPYAHPTHDAAPSSRWPNEACEELSQATAEGSAC